MKVIPSLLAGGGIVLGICFYMGTVPIVDTKTDRTQVLIVGIGLGTQGYVDEYSEFPPLPEDAFFAALAGRNPKGIQFVRLHRASEDVGCDAWGRRMKVLHNNETLLVWSAGIDGRFENSLGEGDDLSEVFSGVPR